MPGQLKRATASHCALRHGRCMNELLLLLQYDAVTDGERMRRFAARFRSSSASPALDTPLPLLFGRLYPFHHQPVFYSAHALSTLTRTRTRTHIAALLPASTSERHAAREAEGGALAGGEDRPRPRPRPRRRARTSTLAARLEVAVHCETVHRKSRHLGCWHQHGEWPPACPATAATGATSVLGHAGATG